jgi:hypothetical protein
MAEIPKSLTAKEYRQYIDTGKLQVGKKGRIIAPKLTAEHKSLISKYDTMFNAKANNAYSNQVEFIIPHKLITLNEYIDKERGHRIAAAKIKKSLTAVCANFAKDIKGVIDPAKQYDIQFFWTTPNNMIDADNITFGQKFILDGIVQAGVLKDDTRRHVRNLHHNIETVKGVTQVKIVLTLITKK